MSVPHLNIRLKSLELTNFRGFRNVELSFDSGKDVIVFIADNGSGKTTLLDALAEFLRFFRHKAIYAAHGANETFSGNGRIDPRYDVTNGTLISEGRVILEIEYPFIPVELLEWLCACIDWLNEIEVDGSAAALVFDDEESMYVLSVRQVPEGRRSSEMVADYVFPETLMSSLNSMQTNTRQSLIEFLDEQIRSGEYELHFASNTGGNWEMSPDFDLVSFPTVHKGTVSLKFSMNARVPDSLTFHVEESRPRDVKILIESLKNGKAYVEDFANAASFRSPYEDGDSLDMTYPILVYYGGSAISTRFDKKLKLPYSAGWFQPYSHALEPDRFDFAEFFSWAMYTKETAPHQWDLLKSIVLDVLNPPSEGKKIYTDLLIEAQELVVAKRVGKESLQKVKLKQLSAGEKNILALVCDLVKRAIQLNPHLVPENQGDEKKGENEKEEETVNFLNPVPGIVLIDEIDLHLHPKWQRGVLTKLRKYSPDVQFFVTTHSPFVLQSLKNEEASLVLLGGFDIRMSNSVYRFYGREILHILYSLMGVSMKRPKEIQEMIDDVYKLIEDERLDEAEKKLEHLRELLTGDDSEVIRLQTIIEFQRL